MKTHHLDDLGETLSTVGWFIPPYVSYAFLDTLAQQIRRAKGMFTQDHLEVALSFIYDAERLASMVLHRYPRMPVIEQFAETIAESVSAHFLGLRHVSVGGLIPVIEGSGRRLAQNRGIKRDGSIGTVFSLLANDAKADVIKRHIGAVDQIVSMLDSFLTFIKRYFYSPSQAYPLADGTNRHGIAHGAYADTDYGRPINFFKAIAAVDFLTFVASLRTPTMSGFAPERTADSHHLAERYISTPPKQTL
jgi:hypothetical protein